MTTEKLVQITALTRGNEAWIVAITNYGRIWLYTPTTPPTGHGTWTLIDMPPGFTSQEFTAAEKLNVAGRLHKGYELYKRNDNGLFYWEREEDHVQSEQFERLEGAIASARQDWMLRHPPAPPLPNPPQEVVR